MQRGSVVGARVRFFYNTMLHVNFNCNPIYNGRPLHSSMHTTSVYYNRIWLVGFMYILGLINIHEVVTWLIKIA